MAAVQLTGLGKRRKTVICRKRIKKWRHEHVLVGYLSKSEITSRQNDNLYPYFEFVAIEFTCRLHIL